MVKILHLLLVSYSFTNLFSDPTAILPLPTPTVVGAGCLNNAVGPINATDLSDVSLCVTPVPQVQSEDSELRDEPAASLPARRPQRLQALLNGNDASRIDSHRSSIAFSMVSTKSKGVLSCPLNLP